MPWNALGRGYSAILAQHYPATALSSPTQWKTLSTKGPKLSARIWKNISVRMHDSRAICDLAESACLANRWRRPDDQYIIDIAAVLERALPPHMPDPDRFVAS